MLITIAIVLATTVFFQIIGFLTICNTNIKLDIMLQKLEEGDADGTRIDNNKKHT